MQTLDNLGWAHANGADKDLGLLRNDNVNELAQVAVGVVIVGLARTVANLGDGQVDTKGRALVHELGLEVGNLRAQLLGGEGQAADDAETAGIGHCGREAGARGHEHARQDDRVLDADCGD